MYQLLIVSKLTTIQASCAADAVLSTMGPKSLAASLQDNDPNSALDHELSDAVSAGVRGCS